jgi:hypothetical protein
VRHEGVIVNFSGNGANNVFRRDVVKLNAARKRGLEEKNDGYYKGYSGSEYWE